jgi:hypothetical protein
MRLHFGIQSTALRIGPEEVAEKVLAGLKV